MAESITLTRDPACVEVFPAPNLTLIRSYIYVIDISLTLLNFDAISLGYRRDREIRAKWRDSSDRPSTGDVES